MPKKEKEKKDIDFSWNAEQRPQPKVANLKKKMQL